MHRHTVELPCIPPFDLRLSLSFLRGFGPMVGEQEVTDESVTKAVMHRGQVVAFTVRQGSGARLSCQLVSQHPFTTPTVDAVSRRVASFLSTEDDLAPFHARAERDAPFAKVARRLRGLHHVKFATPFEAACWGVINQRVPRAVARSMKTALVRRVGGLVTVGDHEHWAFPEPARVADMDEAELLALLKNERKAKAIAAVARAFDGVDEAMLRSAPLAEVEEWLQDIYGVGEFTTNFVLFRGLGRFRAQPLQDKLLAAASETYGRSISETEFHERSRSYGEWGGYWALYLWASTFVEVAA